MNILLVTMALGIGGVETHIIELAKELVRRGNRVSVAANSGIYADVLREAGAEVIILPLDSRDPRAMLASYKGIKKYISACIQSGKPIDIIHAHARIPCMICSRLYKSMHGAFHYVTTVHGVYKTLPGSKLLIKWGERSLAVSDDVKKYLVDGYGVNAKNIEITVNGVDIDKFSPASDDDYCGCIARKTGLNPNCMHRIMHVSRIDAASSEVAFQLIETLPALHEKYSDVEIVIIGMGTEFDSLYVKVKEMNEGLGYNAAVLLGARSDVAELLRCGDCFVGVSRAALEAMACGLPTVLAGAQGYFGIFDESKESLAIAWKTNFCFRDCKPSSTKKLTTALSELFGYDDKKLAVLGSHGRDIVKKYYSVSRMADDAEKMYKSVLD